MSLKEDLLELRLWGKHNTTEGTTDVDDDDGRLYELSGIKYDYTNV